MEVYHRPYGEGEVLVCLDETSKQLEQETRQPRPSRPGAAMAYDYEYQCNGVSNLFMLFAPLEGWRRVEVTDRRTKADWARVVKKLVDEDYVDKERIVLVMDNLNTHHPASYTRLSSRRRHGALPNGWRYITPRSTGVGLIWPRSNWGCWRGSAWIAGIPSQEVLERETGAWQDQRNRDVIQVDWRFTTEDARIKLKSLYPSIQQ